jgi:hypothetical protein
MNDKVLIKQGDVPRRAAAIAQLESGGAEAEFEPEEALRAPEPMDEDDDCEDKPGRVLTEEEFMKRLQCRMDIFKVEKDDRLRKVEAACLVAGIASGILLTKQEMATVVHPDFYDKFTKEISARLIGPQEIPGVLKPQKPEPRPVKVAMTTPKKSLRPNHSTGSGVSQGDNGGDPRERVTKKGVLGLISGKITGKSVASADIFGRGGFATDIDAIIAGQSGLKQGGSPGAGRRDIQGIGYGYGRNSGMGGDIGLGVDDIIGSLLPAAGDIVLPHPKHTPPTLVPSEPKIVIDHGVLTGGRSRTSIMRVVMQNIAALRYAYNKRLREKPGLKGKITCKFAIDEFGKVIFCEMIESTITDPLLEAEVVAKIRTWVFEKIDKPGDVTEVVYPFAFSQ